MSYTEKSNPYVILVNQDNTLVTTQKARIMQRSKLVDMLWFLVPQTYNENAMSNFTVLLEYVMPISRRYRAEILVLSDEMYNGHLVYQLPFDTKMTEEHGDIELHLSFVYVELDENGNAVQRVRKTSDAVIPVIPISAWSDIIPDSVLSALDQRIIKTDAQIKAINEYNNNLQNSKADDISINEETHEIQLVANGKKIGSKIVVAPSTSNKDGVPVVDFSVIAPDYNPDAQQYNNVVEF